MGSQRRRVAFRPGCESFEGRTLLSTVAPLGPSAEVRASAPAPLGIDRLVVEPHDGREPILRAIAAARREIRLGICNLSDPTIGDALAAAAARGVDVRVIVDRGDYLAKPPEQREVARLIGRGVAIRLSNPVFPQSFEKVMVVDRRAVMIMTLCLVPQSFEDTRDYAVLVARPEVTRAVVAVFDADWSHSAPPGEPEPPYRPSRPPATPGLLWGPDDATTRLSRLIRSARRSIDLTTELIDDPRFEGLLADAADRGVHVRLIAPLEARNGQSNAAPLSSLADRGVLVRATVGTSPPPGALPYMHAKTMVVDGRIGYLGSIDLVAVQRSRDRELGLLFRRPDLIRPLRAQFQADWGRAIEPPR